MSEQSAKPTPVKPPRRMPIQVPVRPTIPEPIARMIYAEYERQHGDSQSFERLHERGGFGVEEALHLLCQRIIFVEARAKGAKHADARQMAQAWPPKDTTAPGE